MPKIWRENQRIATRARTEAMSGWVITWVTSGERCVWRVLIMPKRVVVIWMRGLVIVEGRRVWRREM